MKELEKNTEVQENELLQYAVHDAKTLEIDLFNRYLAFLDVLLAHQVEQEQYQGSQE